MAAVEASAGRVGIWVEVVVLNNPGKGNGCSKHVELSDFHGEVGISAGPSNLRFTVTGSAAMKEASAGQWLSAYWVLPPRFVEVVALVFWSCFVFSSSGRCGRSVHALCRSNRTL